METQVDTSKVTGRRELHFSSLSDAADDAEKLAQGSWRQLGNWSLGQIAKHLAISLDNTREDKQFQAPWFVRLIMPLFKKSFINNTLKPGFKMPEVMRPLFMPPEEITTNEGVAALREAVDRFENAPSLPERSTALGKMSREEWNNFHCRHAEMHLSFIVPVGDGS